MDGKWPVLVTRIKLRFPKIEEVYGLSNSKSQHEPTVNAHPKKYSHTVAIKSSSTWRNSQWSIEPLGEPAFR